MQTLKLDKEMIKVFGNFKKSTANLMLKIPGSENKYKPFYQKSHLKWTTSEEFPNRLICSIKLVDMNDDDFYLYFIFADRKLDFRLQNEKTISFIEGYEIYRNIDFYPQYTIVEGQDCWIGRPRQLHTEYTLYSKNGGYECKFFAPVNLVSKNDVLSWYFKQQKED